MVLIISSDEIKKSIPGYNPKKSHLVHRQSAKLADTQYEDALRTCPYDQVILLSGGAASGKTEFVSEYLANEKSIVVDGTLPSFEGAQIKIKKALKSGRRVEVIAVWPADLSVAFSTFLQRDRKFPDEHFYRTHSQSRKTLLQIALSDLETDIKLYKNDLRHNKLAFYEYAFAQRDYLIEFIRENQYTEEEIFNEVTI